MKIGIITFHFAYNCGAVLQCLALSEKLEQLGHEVCVINYQPWYHKNRYTPLKNPVYYAKKRAQSRGKGDTVKKQFLRGAKGFANVVYSWRHYPKVSKIDKYFTKFAKKNLHETHIYRTFDQLVKNPPKCDLYISGSDQLWNGKLTDGKIDPAYLLEFGSSDIRKITYSMGVSFKGSEQPIEEIKSSLMNLDSISLREEEYYNQINELTEGKVPMHVDVDPTFLLKKDEYDKYMPKEALYDGKFIFTYTMPDKSQQEVYKAAKALGKKLNMRVIDASGNPKMANKTIEDNRICGPGEFLWYIKNAEYVVTNSFHGTAFSINMEKNFVTIPHSMTGYRVTEIMDKLGLGNRYAPNSKAALACFDSPADIERSSASLDELRNKSIDYLKEQTS